MPYILWGTIGVFFAFAKYIAGRDGTDFSFAIKFYHMLTGLGSDNYPLWFLVAFFVSKSAYDIINQLLSSRIFNNSNKTLWEFVFVVTVSAAAYVYTIYKTFGHSYMRFDTGLIMLPFFAIGHHLPNLFNRIISNKVLEGTVLFLMLTINFVSGIILNELVSVNSNEYGNIAMFFISTVSGTLSIFILCNHLENIKPIRALLSCVGRNSLIVLCCHSFFLSVIGFANIYLFHTVDLHPLVSTIICLVIMIPTLPILDRFTKVTQKFIFSTN